MSVRVRWIAGIWLGVLVFLYIYGLQGGDAAILATWLTLIWTLPFSVIWFFWLERYVYTWIPSPIVDKAGAIAVAVLTFLFLFVFIPKLHESQLRKRQARLNRRIP